MTPSNSDTRPDAVRGGKAHLSNWEMAYRAERKLVTRCFHRHSSEARASLAASFRLTPNQRTSVGEFFYIHPACPNVAFRTRKEAALAALKASESPA